MIATESSFFDGIKQRFLQAAKDTTVSEFDLHCLGRTLVLECGKRDCVDGLKFIREEGSRLTGSPDGAGFVASAELVQASALNGSLSVMRYLVEELSESERPVDICHDLGKGINELRGFDDDTDPNCATAIALAGHIEMLKYLVEEAPKFGQKNMVGKINIDTLAAAGKIDALRYVLEDALGAAHHHPFMESLLQRGVGSRSLEMLEYLCEVLPDKIDREWQREEVQYGICSAVENGHRDQLRYLLEVLPYQRPTFTDLNDEVQRSVRIREHRVAGDDVGAYIASVKDKYEMAERLASLGMRGEELKSNVADMVRVTAKSNAAPRPRRV